MTAPHPEPTGFAPVDRVLGGGLRPRSTTLLVGDRGSGKTTLLMQLAHAYASPDPSLTPEERAVCEDAEQLVGSLQETPAAREMAARLRRGRRVLFASGEESESALLERYQKLIPPSSPETYPVAVTFYLWNDVDNILAAAEQCGATLLVVDSLSTVQDASLKTDFGSQWQMRRVVNRLAHWARERRAAVVAVSHYNRRGGIRTPSTAHIADTVLHLDNLYDDEARLLRLTTSKHRLGPTGVRVELRMTKMGLQPA